MAVDHVLGMLMADIVAHPEDDGPRLAFADRLEETGADDARAEFIRVQVELARTLCHQPVAPGEPKRTPHSMYCNDSLCRHCELDCAEARLWGRHYARWADALPGPWTAHGVSTDGCQAFMSSADNSGVARLWFRRGFASRVRLASADWLGDVSRPGWGPALARAAPLARAGLSDRQPSPHPLTSLPRLWSWYGGGLPAPSAYVLRWDLFKRLPGWLDQDRMDYASRADAGSALSAACLAWARAVAPAGAPA